MTRDAPEHSYRPVTDRKRHAASQVVHMPTRMGRDHDASTRSDWDPDAKGWSSTVDEQSFDRGLAVPQHDRLGVVASFDGRHDPVGGPCHERRRRRPEQWQSGIHSGSEMCVRAQHKHAVILDPKPR